MSERLGMAVPIQHSLTVPECVELARHAETAGYNSIWVPEVVGADAFVLMAAMAGVTTRLQLGTGIVPILTRTPTLIAMSAASLAQLAPGRVCLGLGVSTPNIIQNWHGIPYDRPLARIRDYVTIIRQALAGARVSHEAGVYPLRNFRLGLSAPPRIPIYMAALNPRMLQLAGEVADGVLLNWLPEEQVHWALGHLESGAGKGGRTLADLDIACLVRACVTDEVNAARQWLRRELTGYAIVEAYQRYFRQIGFGREVEAILTKWRAGDRSGAVEEVSDHMTDRLAVFGSSAQCRLRIKALVDAGVSLPIVFPFSPEADYQASIYRTLGELGPEASGWRSTTAS